MKRVGCEETKRFYFGGFSDFFLQLFSLWRRRKRGDDDRSRRGAYGLSTRPVNEGIDCRFVCLFVCFARSGMRCALLRRWFYNLAVVMIRWRDPVGNEVGGDRATTKYGNGAPCRRRAAVSYCR